LDQDIGLLGERDWNCLTLNKEELKKLLEKDRAHTRLWSQ
jgi:hypothetical protein